MNYVCLFWFMFLLLVFLVLNSFCADVQVDSESLEVDSIIKNRVTPLYVKICATCDMIRLSAEKRNTIGQIKAMVNDLVNFWFNTQKGMDMFHLFTVPGVVNMLKNEFSSDDRNIINNYIVGTGFVDIPKTKFSSGGDGYIAYVRFNAYMLLLAENAIVRGFYQRCQIVIPKYYRVLPEYYGNENMDSIAVPLISALNRPFWSRSVVETKKLIYQSIEALKSTPVIEWLIQKQTKQALAQMFLFLVYAAVDGSCCYGLESLFSQVERQELHVITNKRHYLT